MLSPLGHPNLAMIDDMAGVFSSRDLVRGEGGTAESRAYVCFHHSDIRALR